MYGAWAAYLTGREAVLAHGLEQPGHLRRMAGPRIRQDERVVARVVRTEAGRPQPLKDALRLHQPEGHTIKGAR
jgi:hypothetical protein